MIKQGSGVILMFGGSGPPMRDYYIGGTPGGIRGPRVHAAPACF
jgi:hypothetical protein